MSPLGNTCGRDVAVRVIRTLSVYLHCPTTHNARTTCARSRDHAQRSRISQSSVCLRTPLRLLPRDGRIHRTSLTMGGCIARCVGWSEGAHPATGRHHGPPCERPRRQLWRQRPGARVSGLLSIVLLCVGHKASCAIGPRKSVKKGSFEACRAQRLTRPAKAASPSVTKVAVA